MGVRVRTRSCARPWPAPVRDAVSTGSRSTAWRPVPDALPTTPVQVTALPAELRRLEAARPREPPDPGSHPARGPPGSGPSRWRCPPGLPVVLFWATLTVCLAVILGVFRPIVVLPAIGLAVAATWRFGPSAVPG